MSYRASRRTLQGVAVAAALAVAGPVVAAERPVDDPVQQEQPTPNPNPNPQQGVDAQPYEPDRGDGMSWGWLGLLGLAGLLGLRRREYPDVRPRTTTTTNRP